jgi:hypothetical protein
MSIRCCGNGAPVEGRDAMPRGGSCATPAGQGLVDVEPQFGLSTWGISASDLENLVTQRFVLEGRARRECIAHSCLEWQSNVLVGP